MAKEIERKFLVRDSSFLKQLTPTVFKQAYLNSHKERTVRVRIQGEQAFITIKSKSTGISRDEFEYPIPMNEAEQLLMLCETTPIEKNRYFLQQGKHCFEIDEFFGSNKGLILAEIELKSEDEAFEKPEWLGEEVSLDKRYFNSALSLKPFSEW